MSKLSPLRIATLLLMIVANSNSAVSAVPVVRNLGDVGAVFVFSYDALAAEEKQLGLALHETLALQQAERRIKARVGSKALRDRLTAFSNLSIEDYFKKYKEYKSQVEDLNADALLSIDEILKKPSRKKRCRQLMSLGAIRFNSVEAFLRINDLAVSVDEFKLLMQPSNDEGKQGPLIYEVACRHLAASGLMSEEEIAIVGGQPFQSGIVATGLTDLSGEPLQNFYHDAHQRILMNTKVRKELKLSIGQVTRVEKFKKEFDATMSTVAAQTLVLGIMSVEDENEQKKLVKKVEEQVASWRKLQEKRVAEILGEEQLLRFNQLLFQYYARRFKLDWALSVAKKSELQPSITARYSEAWPGSRSIKVETGYISQANQLKSNLDRFYRVLGRKKVDSIIGKVALSPVVGSNSIDKQHDLVLRSQALQIVLDNPASRQQVNPRRAAKISTAN